MTTAAWPTPRRCPTSAASRPPGSGSGQRGCFEQYGITRIARVLTDNGSCYRSRVFAEALAQTDTTHKRTRPHTPKTNGKVERFNGTLAREWAYAHEFFSEEERTSKLHEFINYYNHQRPHHGIGLKPPISRLPVSKFRLSGQVYVPHSIKEKQMDLYELLEPTS